MTASSWWFGDDVIANRLSGLSDANAGLIEQVPLMEPTSDTYVHPFAIASASEIERFNAAVAVVSRHGSDELPRMQHQQSSHPGSYDVLTPAPKQDVKPVGKEAVQPTSERHDSRPVKTYEARNNNAIATHSASSAQSGKSATVVSKANRPAPQGPEQGAKHSDLSVALAGMVGWGAMAASESKEASNLLRRNGFKQLRSKCDNDRFLSYRNQERDEAELELAGFPGRTNDGSNDASQQL